VEDIKNTLGYRKTVMGTCVVVVVVDDDDDDDDDDDNAVCYL
jgi:hypothetical protein